MHRSSARFAIGVFVALVGPFTLIDLAQAQDGETATTPLPPTMRPEVGVRTGIGYGNGPTYGNDAITPVDLIGGVRVLPELFLGGSVGFVSAHDVDADGCGAACTTFRYRIGVEARVDLRPRSIVNPWLGYGVFYEHARTTWATDGGGHQSWWGLAFMSVRFGVDFRLGDHFSFGPLVNVAVGKPGHVETEKAGVTYVGTPADSYKSATIGLGARYAF